ncbi:MAG: putative porin [Cyclobacteriaceae bacterium]
MFLVFQGIIALVKRLNLVLFFLLILLLPGNSQAQVDSVKSKLNFTADFRFRLEQDWNSKKADGTMRDDRSRLRYRLRFGSTYQYDNQSEFGLRIRTGQQNKQQDPQLTLGDGLKEFGTLPIGFEKIYFQRKHQGWKYWVGKNTFPFKKQNELFWSDNVYPEGVALSKSIDINSNFIQKTNITAGHFILNARSRSFGQDSYFQGFQLHTSHFAGNLQLFPAIYLFRNIPDIPDGGETFFMDYSIFHLGSSFRLLAKPNLSIKLDCYENLAEYGKLETVPAILQDQKNGYTVGIAVGELASKGDWYFELTYAYLERFAVVDFIAQNDWARWDYSAYDSPDGRLTNLKGLEFVAAYCIDKHYTVRMKYYAVNQLVAQGTTLETGNRIRFDLDIGF